MARDYAAIKEVIGYAMGRSERASAGPFSRLGWFSELRNWIESVVEPMGFHVNGRFQQLNASASFSLIRFETDGPALWFKAVGEPNQKNSHHLRFGSALPGIPPADFAVSAGLEWMAYSGGPKERCLSEVQEKALRGKRQRVALAKLQIESIDRGAPILGIGARDLGSTALSKLFSRSMSVVAQLMEHQTKVHSTRSQPQRVGAPGQTHSGALLRRSKPSGIPESARDTLI